jgi:uncharacterized membrane protein YoaK (UPF0700 family)
MNTVNEPKQNIAGENAPRGYEPLLPTLLTMTLVTGLVDAVSFLGLSRHVFTANMTGNVALLGFAVAGAPRLSIAGSLTSLLAFLSGAVFGGRLGIAMCTVTRQRWFLTAASAEAALLFMAGVASRSLTVGSADHVSRLYAVIVLTAVAMGLRTATVRRLGVVDITTTVLTSTLAALAADSSLGGGNNPRIGRRVGSVLSMLSGAAIGALLLRFGLALPLVLGGILVLAAAFAYTSLPSSRAAAQVA